MPAEAAGPTSSPGPLSLVVQLPPHRHPRRRGTHTWLGPAGRCRRGGGPAGDAPERRSAPKRCDQTLRSNAAPDRAQPRRTGQRVPPLTRAVRAGSKRFWDHAPEDISDQTESEEGGAPPRRRGVGGRAGGDAEGDGGAEVSGPIATGQEELVLEEQAALLGKARPRPCPARARRGGEGA